MRETSDKFSVEMQILAGGPIVSKHDFTHPTAGFS